MWLTMRDVHITLPLKYPFRRRKAPADHSFPSASPSHLAPFPNRWPRSVNNEPSSTSVLLPITSISDMPTSLLLPCSWKCLCTRGNLRLIFKMKQSLVPLWKLRQITLKNRLFRIFWGAKCGGMQFGSWFMAPWQFKTQTNQWVKCFARRILTKPSVFVSLANLCPDKGNDVDGLRSCVRPLVLTEAAAAAPCPLISPAGSLLAIRRRLRPLGTRRRDLERRSPQRRLFLQLSRC